jgi:hypothetical protein
MIYNRSLGDVKIHVLPPDNKEGISPWAVQYEVSDDGDMPVSVVDLYELCECA